MTPNLIEFWKEFEPKQSPYFHPDDKDMLEREYCFASENEPIDHKSYLASSRFGAPNDNRFHLSLLPIPYVGNLAKADIFVLLLNPGFQHSEYWAQTEVAGFRERLIRNLYQESLPNESPFFCLDPNYCWYSGFQWWEKKLRKVIQLIAKKSGRGYQAAMLELSSRLACIELVPYASSAFDDHHLINNLKSAEIARNFVAQQIVLQARTGKTTVVVTRQVKGWGLQASQETDNLVLYSRTEARSADLGPKSRGGKAILRCFEIDPAQIV